MSAMCRNFVCDGQKTEVGSTKKSNLPSSFFNEKGMGLIAAIFIIVVLAVFGVLIARFTSTTSVTSVEDYLWAQALYSAEAASQLRILNHDGGGNWGAFSYPVISNFTITSVTDNFSGAGNPATLDVRADRANIVRQIQVNYIL